MQYIQRIVSGNRITIPQPVLEGTGLKKGDLILIEEGGGKILITPADIKPRETPLDKLEQAEHD